MLSTVLFLVVSNPFVLNGKPADKAWSVLDAGLHDKSSEHRVEALQALAVIPATPKVVSLAENALTDPSSDVRAQAAQTLGKLKATGSSAKLHETLKDKEVKVVIAAANALYELKDPVAYQVFYALLTGERKSSEGLVAGELDTLRDRKQMEKLVLETGIGFVPFGGMGWQAWKTITQDDSSPVKAAAAEKLASDPDPKTAAALVNAMNDKKWRVRAAAVNAIGLRGDPKLLNEVIPAMFDGTNVVRCQAAATVLTLSSPHRTRFRRTSAPSAPRVRAN